MSDNGGNGGSAAGVVAIVAIVVLVLAALLFVFRSRLFNGGTKKVDVNITVPAPAK